MKVTFKNVTQIKMNRFKMPLLLIASFFIMASTSWGATYYVSTGGNDSNSGSLSSPWKTITKANGILKAGDTVYIMGGVYSGQAIKPSNSGTSDNRIVYQNYDSEKVTITETSTGVQLTGRSYISVQGINFSNIDVYVTMANGSNHNHVEHCNFDKMRNYGSWRGIGIGPNARYNRIRHCTISRHGYFTSTDDKGDMIYIGDSNQVGGAEYNLIENNTIFSGGHALVALHDRYNVFRKNYLHHEEWYVLDGKVYGNRCLYSNRNPGSKAGWNLIEGNRFALAGLPSDANWADGIQLATPDNIIRQNHFYSNKGGGIVLSTYPSGINADRNYIYNNNFFKNGYNTSTSRVSYGIAYAAWTDSIVETVLKNNIFWKNKNGAINFYTTDPSSQEVSNNLISGDPLFSDDESTISSDDPMVPDFSLQSDSPCIDAGEFLTQTSTTGNGTVMKVVDAHYFMDGWGIIEGDVIQLEGTTHTAQIIDVDYSTNTITLSTALSWIANQGVSLKFAGGTPDIGALEYGMSDTPADETELVFLFAPQNLRIIE